MKRLTRNAKRLLSLFLTLVIVLTFLPLTAAPSFAAGSLSTQTPIVVITGKGIIGNGGVYTAGNVSFERSYTLDDLKALASMTQAYSAVNTSDTKNFYLATGIPISELLKDTAFDASKDRLIIEASDGYAISFDPEAAYVHGSVNTTGFGEERYYYPEFQTGSAANAVSVPTILAWANSRSTEAVPAAAEETNTMTVIAGQLNVDDRNNSLFNRDVSTIRSGDKIETALTINGKNYTRAEILMMERSERSYTYQGRGEVRTEVVRGVPLKVLLDGVNRDEKVNFSTADNFSVTASGMTVGELIDSNYILAYEMMDGTVWNGIYRDVEANRALSGVFTLYGDGERPAAMITDISAGAAGAISLYKHISHDGAPYNLDAITGATLTIEGPGVDMSVPITVRQLQETVDSNIYRGVYSDDRGQRSYEGIRLLSLLDGHVNENISLLDDNVEIVFKNRWRQDIGRLTYGEISAADSGNTPVVLAYGIANADESNTRPFVFDGGAGENTTLGNGDGPLRLVYNQRMAGEMPSSGFFPSVAYIYVEEHGGRPGFMHINAADPAFNNAANTEFLITFNGDALGREVTFTVRELEEMVAYDEDLDRPAPDGIGHRDEYSLSNTTYWYVNEYEGIKLWDLLTVIGLPESKSSDDSTLVSFSSWDNYRISTQFSLRQLADPDLFFFYEKSPLDIGTDRPSKEQLATEEFQPDNQGTGWTEDANGYPVRKGYPVLLAYGINGYPYVRDSSLPGFRTGLGNDGGPMRLIYGKTDGLNRSNPDALENYAYFFNNGSQQLQRVQEVYVGNEVRYSTHNENPDPAYQAMKDRPALTVDIVSAGVTVSHSFTLAELEEIIYGVEKRVRDGEGRQEKGYYYYETAANGGEVQDLFEGVNLEYLLAEHIGLQGILGTVQLHSGNGRQPAAIYDLTSIGEKGYNSLSGVEGLGMMVAFAKNSYPLVSDRNSPGYIHDDPHIAGRAIMNSGGPLMFVRGQTAGERDSGSITDAVDNKTSVENLTRIVVNLEPDVFAHVGPGHSENASREIVFSGAVAQSSGVRITVGALETMQRHMTTGTYSIDGTARVYRGLDLLSLLNSKAIGASGLMNEVVVTGADGAEVTIALTQLMDASNTGKPMILAYGAASGGAPDYTGAAPLEPPYGPIRLIIDGAAGAQCVSNVIEIAVVSSQLEGWRHNTGVYAQYAESTLQITGQNLIHNAVFTVAELESMDNILVFDTYTVGPNIFWSQGVDLYKLMQNIGFSGDLDSSEFTATAIDGYSMQFTGSQLKDGVNGRPIIVAFGQGTTQDNGLPLVPNDTDPGYSPIAINDGGPLRLMVHDNSGWSVKFLSSIVVGAAGGQAQQPDTAQPVTAQPDTAQPDAERLELVKSAFTAYQGDGGEGFPEAGVRSIDIDGTGGMWVGTYGGGIAHLPRGSGSFAVHGAGSGAGLRSAFASGVAADASGGLWFTQNASYTDFTQNHGVGYMAADGTITYFNTREQPGTIPDDYVQVIEIDASGNVWFGSFGGLTRYSTADGEWRTWTKEDGLPAGSVNTIVFDDAGGVWIGCYPDAVGSVDVAGAGTVDAYAGGYAYLDAGGVISFAKVYDYRDEPDLLPWLMADFWVRGIAIDNNGGVWVVRSSSFMPHVGGRVDYVSPDKSSIMSWTGNEMLGAAALSGTQEIRDVAVDKNGGLWFGTSGAGLFHCTAPGAVYGVYSTDVGAWPSGTNLDNIFVLKFVGDTLYIGSAGGVALSEAALLPGIAPSGKAGQLAGALAADGGDNNMTRVEIIDMLAGLTTGISTSSPGGTGFRDVQGSAGYAANVRWAAGLGIVRGYPDGLLNPNNLITREDFAVMMDRFIKAMHIEPSAKQAAAAFSDFGTVSPYAADSVQAMNSYGIMSGRTDGSFDPKGPVSRAEASEVIGAYIERFLVW